MMGLIIVMKHQRTTSSSLRKNMKGGLMCTKREILHIQILVFGQLKRKQRNGQKMIM